MNAVNFQIPDIAAKLALNLAARTLTWHGCSKVPVMVHCHPQPRPARSVGSVSTPSARMSSALLALLDVHVMPTICQAPRARQRVAIPAQLLDFTTAPPSTPRVMSFALATVVISAASIKTTCGATCKLTSPRWRIMVFGIRLGHWMGLVKVIQ